MASILWLSADPVAEASMGVADRSEGVRHFLRRGDDATVVCGGGRGHRPVDGIPTVFLPTRYVPMLGWLWLWPKLLRTLERLGPRADVIVTDFALLPALMWWRARRGARGASAPAVVLDVRTPPVEAGAVRARVQRWRFRATLRRFGPRVEAITTISDGLRDEVARLARLPAASVAVWGSGCSWCEAEPDDPIPEPRDRRPGDRVVVVYHGSVSAGRGLFEAVRAVDAIRADAPDLRLTVLGAGPALPALRTLVAELRLADRVTFLDPVPQDRVRDVLRRANVGLVPLPRRWEWEVSSPLKLVEYLCAGLPVIITDIRAHRVVPEEAAFAFRAPSADPSDLAAAMLRAYERRDALAVLGREAAAWSRPRLRWSAQLSVLEGVVDRLLAGRSAGQEGTEARVGGVG